MKKMSLQQCIERYRDVCTGLDFKGTNIFRYSVIYPRGTNLILGYIEAPGISGREDLGWYIHVTATKPITPKEAKSIENRLRRHICNRIIPRSGRSVFKETPSKFGILKSHVRIAEGQIVNAPILCSEVSKEGIPCNGVFIPDAKGEYICQNCGVIHEYKSTFIEYEDEDSDEYDENTYYDVLQSDSASLDNSRFIEANAEWKASLEYQPEDELRARQTAHERKQRHEECKALNKKKNSRSNQTLIYQGKWSDLKSKARLSKIIQVVKTGITDKVELRDFIIATSRDKYHGTRANFYRDLDLLVTQGKIIITRTEDKKKVISLTAPPRPVRHFPVQIEKVPIPYNPRDVRPSVMVYHRTLKCSKCGEPFEITSMDEFKNVACSKCVKAIEDES